MSTPRSRRRKPSGWAVSGMVFAASILTLIGSFQIIAGLTAIFNDDFYVVARNYTFDIDATAWGWVHLLVGILLVVTAFGLFSGSTWARATRIGARGHQRGRQLLLHPVLPLLVDPRDRPRRMGDLGAHPPRNERDRRRLTPT